MNLPYVGFSYGPPHQKLKFRGADEAGVMEVVDAVVVRFPLFGAHHRPVFPRRHGSFFVIASRTGAHEVFPVLAAVSLLGNDVVQLESLSQLSDLQI